MAGEGSGCTWRASGLAPWVREFVTDWKELIRVP